MRVRWAFLVCTLGLALLAADPAAAACRAGDEACPVVLRMKPGAVSIKASGSVTGERPEYYFKFDGRAGQKMTLHMAGRNLKTGPGIPITLPAGGSDAVDEGVPYTLPATGPMWSTSTPIRCRTARSAVSN